MVVISGFVPRILEFKTIVMKQGRNFLLDRILPKMIVILDIKFNSFLVGSGQHDTLFSSTVGIVISTLLTCLIFLDGPELLLETKRTVIEGWTSVETKKSLRIVFCTPRKKIEPIERSRQFLC